MGLKSFMLREELKVSHAERYLAYAERHSNEVFHELKQKLEKSWEAAVKKTEHAHPIHKEVIQDAVLRNPKATTSVSLSRKSEKLITSRSPVPLEVAPSVKIPLIYSPEERKLVTKSLLSAARDAFEETVDAWSVIFNYEKNGRRKPWFKISADHEEVRLQLAMTEGDAESYKTLYAVRIEYGKKGTKTRDFDRLYLVNLIK